MAGAFEITSSVTPWGRNVFPTTAISTPAILNEAVSHIKCPLLSDDFVFENGDSVFAAIFAVLFAILGICLNVLVIVALMHYRRTRRHVTTPFIISLSFSDLVYSGFILPIMAARFDNQESPLGETWCKVYPLIYYGTMGASLLSLTMVTLNRAFMLFLPSRVDSIFTNNRDIGGHKVPINSLIILFLCWIIPMLMLLPSFTGTQGKMGLQLHTQSCTILPDKEGDNPKKLFYAIGFGIPSVTLIVSDIAIYFKMKSMHKSDNRMSVATLDERKMEKVFMLMLGAIFVFFVVTYVPGIVVKAFDPCFSKPTLHVLAYVINWASVWVNPIIYVVSQKKYQDAIRHLRDAFKKCGPGAAENKHFLPSFNLNSDSSKSKSQDDITRHPTVTNKHLDSLKPKSENVTNSVSDRSSGIGSNASID
eukprot:GFUD01010370.1.p1 GENE.GFUD01010370.1~~GFUD01010370.1.p1  ORF type:complete len:420 (-),score=66.22 GFUD01010370.1:529-1788(-)